MTVQEKESAKALSDMVVEYHNNFVNSGISEIVAGKMAVDLVTKLVKANTQIENEEINP